MSDTKRIRTVEWSFAARLFGPVYLLVGPVYLLVGPVYLLGGCDSQVDGDDVRGPEQLRAWTAYTSDEYPPLECPNGEAVQGIDCTGDYCDKVALYCAATGRASGWSSWLPYFSEEGSGTADEGHCINDDMWLTGLSCKAEYCDDLTIRCAQMIDSWTGTCWWSGWYSDEQPPFYAAEGMFIKGIECDREYCDNKRYHYCQMLESVPH